MIDHKTDNDKANIGQIWQFPSIFYNIFKFYWLGEAEEQNDLEKQAQAEFLRKELNTIMKELKSLGISGALAAKTTGYTPNTLRTEKTKTKSTPTPNEVAPSKYMIQYLREYLVLEKRIREYFKKLQSGASEGLGNNFIVNDGEGKYETRQREETLSIAKEHYAYFKAFVEYEIEKDVNGDEELKKEKLARIEQAAAKHMLSPVKHQSSTNTIYAKGRKAKSKEKDPDQPGPPEDPPL